MVAKNKNHAPTHTDSRGSDGTTPTNACIHNCNEDGNIIHQTIDEGISLEKGIVQKSCGGESVVDHCWWTILPVIIYYCWQSFHDIKTVIQHWTMHPLHHQLCNYTFTILTMKVLQQQG